MQVSFATDLSLKPGRRSMAGRADSTELGTPLAAQAPLHSWSPHLLEKLPSQWRQLECPHLYLAPYLSLRRRGRSRRLFRRPPLTWMVRPPANLSNQVSISGFRSWPSAFESLTSVERPLIRRLSLNSVAITSHHKMSTFRFRDYSSSSRSGGKFWHQHPSQLAAVSAPEQLELVLLVRCGRFVGSLANQNLATRRGVLDETRQGVLDVH